MIGRITGVVLALLAVSAAGQDPFRSVIRPSKPLSPAEELAGFTVPEGFEVQLVAAEPDVFKPMNLAFDAKGRLWVTCSTEYPFAVGEEEKGRDAIKILEDLNNDGRADRITTFADGLNIPIGVYPYKDGAIVFSIPNIWFLRDTNGDGVADKREKLYGPMGYKRDTHGMNNGFTRGFDGWLYACHGFNNETVVKGADGHLVKMNSGNTYRMRLDGSRIEQFTWGQVNPFGMDQDEWGHLFTADCHTKPIYALLRGGYYPSFGKPHDGLGFVPPMMKHLHGSTAIAGVVAYSGTQFPAEYRGNFFGGNVMTSRVNRNQVERHGATVLAKEAKDLLIAKDPWFRPVDLCEGPDGALYVADFYNRIIGHYEVSLKHPGRDRTRGRIWRIVYKGNGTSSTPSKDLTKATVEELLTQLDTRGLRTRLLATDQLVDRIGVPCVSKIEEHWEQAQPAAQPHLLWTLERLGKLNKERLDQAAQSKNAVLRAHVLKVLAERKRWEPREHSIALRGLTDRSPEVRRAAADALGQHPSASHLAPLRTALEQNDLADVFLKHALRIAFRNQLNAANVADAVLKGQFQSKERREMAELFVSIPSAEAARFLTRYVMETEVPTEQLVLYMQHAAKHTAADDVLAKLAKTAEERFADNLQIQSQLFASLESGARTRGSKPAVLAEWAHRLSARLLEDPALDWANTPIGGQAGNNPWEIQQITCKDGKRAGFLSTRPNEQFTGRLRSRPFAAPAKLSFYLAGHLGNPNQKFDPRNKVQLRLVSSGKVIQEARPPRNDTAQPIEWDLDNWQGQQVVLEVVDNDTRPAFAWIAIGRLSVPELRIPSTSPAEQARREVAAAQMLQRFPQKRLVGKLEVLVGNVMGDSSSRAAAASAIAVSEQSPILSAVASVLGDDALTGAPRERLSKLFQSPRTKTESALRELLRSIPLAAQEKLVVALSTVPSGASMVVSEAQKGRLPATTLAHPIAKTNLTQINNGSHASAVKEILKNAPQLSMQRANMIKQRLAEYAASEGAEARGTQLFLKHCASCHQIKGHGKMVGPQLDGIGKRGVARLFEDLLDPNRNVDVAFRTTSLITDEGKVLTGLVRRQEGKTLIFVDSNGNEQRIDTNEIDERRQTPISLMPDDVGIKLKKQELNDLMTFLLAQ